MFRKDTDLVSPISLEDADRNIQRFYAGEISASALFSDTTDKSDEALSENTQDKASVAWLSEEDFFEQLMQSPVSWASVNIPEVKDAIYYPRWNFWNILADPVLLNEIHFRFLTKFSEILTNTYIYAISVPAKAFLDTIEFQLTTLNAPILAGIISEENQAILRQNQDCSQLVIFDLNINIARTISEAVSYIERICPQPYAYITTFMNDLVPPMLRDYPWERSNSKIDWLFRASDLLEYWDDQATVSDIKHVQKAFAGQLDWHSDQVQSSIKHLHQVAQLKHSLDH